MILDDPDMCGMAMDTLNVALTNTITAHTVLFNEDITILFDECLNTLQSCLHPKVVLALLLFIFRILSWIDPLTQDASEPGDAPTDNTTFSQVCARAAELMGADKRVTRVIKALMIKLTQHPEGKKMLSNVCNNKAPQDTQNGLPRSPLSLEP